MWQKIKRIFLPEVNNEESIVSVTNAFSWLIVLFPGITTLLLIYIKNIFPEFSFNRDLTGIILFDILLGCFVVWRLMKKSRTAAIISFFYGVLLSFQIISTLIELQSNLYSQSYSIKIPSPILLTLVYFFCISLPAIFLVFSINTIRGTFALHRIRNLLPQTRVIVGNESLSNQPKIFRLVGIFLVWFLLIFLFWYWDVTNWEIIDFESFILGENSIFYWLLRLIENLSLIENTYRIADFVQSYSSVFWLITQPLLLIPIWFLRKVLGQVIMKLHKVLAKLYREV